MLSTAHVYLTNITYEDAYSNIFTFRDQDAELDATIGNPIFFDNVPSNEDPDFTIDIISTFGAFYCNVCGVGPRPDLPRPGSWITDWQVFFPGGTSQHTWAFIECPETCAPDTVPCVADFGTVNTIAYEEPGTPGSDPSLTFELTAEYNCACLNALYICLELPFEFYNSDDELIASGTEYVLATRLDCWLPLRGASRYPVTYSGGGFFGTGNYWGVNVTFDAPDAVTDPDVTIQVVGEDVIDIDLITCRPLEIRLRSPGASGDETLTFNIVSPYTPYDGAYIKVTGGRGGQVASNSCSAASFPTCLVAQRLCVSLPYEVYDDMAVLVDSGTVYVRLNQVDVPYPATYVGSVTLSGYVVDILVTLNSSGGLTPTGTIDFSGDHVTGQDTDTLTVVSCDPFYATLASVTLTLDDDGTIEFTSIVAVEVLGTHTLCEAADFPGSPPPPPPP